LFFYAPGIYRPKEKRNNGKWVLSPTHNGYIHGSRGFGARVSLKKTGGDMTTVLTRPHETKIGSEARRLRLSLRLSRAEVAALAGVFEQTVNLFEHDLPVALDYRRRILKQLWALKNKK
jgi:hypothetical protein